MSRKETNDDGMRLNREEEEEDDDDVEGMGVDAWERTYVDERSWESMQEDESGLRLIRYLYGCHCFLPVLLIRVILWKLSRCKSSKIRCSIIGPSADLYICLHLCHETGGSYSVALDEAHLKELVLEHAPPPPAIAEFAIANLKLRFLGLHLPTVQSTNWQIAYTMSNMWTDPRFFTPFGKILSPPISYNAI
ncbi:hypothetical protein Pfo_018117 [Paulownia fortunei]|nr:hypothetical protein Pfo_018117 [Paulownia fortunei]